MQYFNFPLQQVVLETAWTKSTLLYGAKYNVSCDSCAVIHLFTEPITASKADAVLHVLRFLQCRPIIGKPKMVKLKWPVNEKTEHKSLIKCVTFPFAMHIKKPVLSKIFSAWRAAGCSDDGFLQRGILDKLMRQYCATRRPQGEAFLHLKWRQQMGTELWFYLDMAYLILAIFQL